jgi:hypothetical protein
MVHSTDSFSPSSSFPHGESGDFAYHEDDDDTSRDGVAYANGVEPTEEAADKIHLNEENCRLIYSTAGSDIMRVCGCSDGCHRVVPTAHKSVPYTETSHAPAGWFVALPPTRKGSKFLDGLLESYQSDEDHQAVLQRRTDANLSMADRLAEASPESSRSFRDEAGSEGSKTPVRPTKALRFAHPPDSTQGRVSFLGTGSLAGASERPTGSSGSTPAAPDVAALTRLLEASLKGQQAFNERVMAALPRDTMTPEATTDDDSDESVEVLGTKARSKNGTKARSKKRADEKHDGKRTKGKKGRGGKASTWYGVVAGQEGSLCSTLSSAKEHARQYDPKGLISSKFDTKAEAREWLANNLDDTDSSDSEDADSADIPVGAGSSRMIPPGRLADPHAAPFELVTQDPSTGKKNELFKVEIKKEHEVFRALAPRGTSGDAQRDLAECIVDSTGLPGTYSEVSGKGGGGQDEEVAKTLSRLLGKSQARGVGAVGASNDRDTGYNSKSRVSLRGVRNLDDLQTLEQELGLAIPAAFENMKLAFGASLDPLGWTASQEDTYLLGGHFPYIGMMSMRYYSDLVRELARRAPHGWARVKVDIDYFVTQLLRIREIGRSRFLVIIRTYIFLRDQQAVGFATIDRMNAQLTSLYERLGAAESREAAPETAGASMCQKCKQKGLHKGGRRGCPFKDLDDTPARKAGTFAAEQCATGGATKTEAYELALNEFS